MLFLCGTLRDFNLSHSKRRCQDQEQSAACYVACGQFVPSHWLTLWESWADDADSCSSAEQQTACHMFNDHDILERASCLPGFFGDNVGLTMCRQCAADSLRHRDGVRQVPGALKG